MNIDFSDIEPYDDNHAAEAMQYIEQHPFLDMILDGLKLNVDREQFRAQVRSIRTVEEFQSQYMKMFVEQIMKNTSKGVTIEGLDQLDPTRQYLFISNHRDIVLDAAMLDVIFVQNDFPTCEISFGDNLLSDEFVGQIARCNRMFPIHRTGSKREQYERLIKTSQYIHYAINEKRVSVWIAQRNGRTKDGDDRTEQGLMKMFAMGQSDSFVDCMDSLHIVPIAISYEIEPCAERKVREIYIRQKEGHYEKEKDEDMRSVIEGALQDKGAIHYTICRPIERKELEACAATANDGDKNKPFLSLANLIDSRIHLGYHLHPTNINAYNVLQQWKQFNLIPEEGHTMEELRMLLYANPVINQKKAAEALKVDSENTPNK